MSSPHQHHFPFSISRHRGTLSATARRGARTAAGIAAITVIAIAATVTVRLTAPAPVPRQPAKAAPRQTRAAAASPVPAAPSLEGNARPAAPAATAPDLSGLRWASYQGGYEVPESASAGPRDVTAGLASGFADTPAGALIAAANIVTRTEWQMGPGIFGPTIEKQVTGPDAMALLQNDEAAYDQDSAQIAQITAYPQFIAYTTVSYTPGDAVFELVAGVTGTVGSAMYEVSTAEVQWTDGDWRLVAPPGGTWAGTYIPSPDGYTLFPGRQQ